MVMLDVMRLRPLHDASAPRVLFTVTLLSLAGGLLAAASTQPSSKPSFVTSDPGGMWNDHGYIVHNNVWNAVYR